jgi:UDP-N-acetylglucosamine 2-epimerase (non-hydrolysing)
VRIATVFGTRPEIIRLSEVIRRLDRHAEHVLIHTGQNFDPLLSDIFFAELDVRAPDVHLGVRAPGFAEQAGQILARGDAELSRLAPDRILILGDTNSGLIALAAARRRIPVFHMEAGNRCYDDRVPEEVNRRVIDHCSTVLMPYTERSKDNLIREGIERDRVFVTGNPIREVLQSNEEGIDRSGILAELQLRPKHYVAVTMHRAENVDQEQRLAALLHGLALTAERLDVPVVVSVHPRTRERMQSFGLSAERLTLLDPLGFADFVKLEREARLVISDSGTVQEECAIFRVPNVTIRDVTERPETIECGSNILSGAEPDDLLRAVDVALAAGSDWTPPHEYMAENVSRTVVKILLGYTSQRRQSGL